LSAAWTGQFMETNFMGIDAQGNLYTGDTTVPRITEIRWCGAISSDSYCAYASVESVQTAIERLRSKNTQKSVTRS
jgi:hypothetical protein